MAKEFKHPDVQKFYDEGKIIWGNDPRLIPRYLPTGISELDNLLDGGLRVRAFSMFAGLEGQGKTWTAQRAIATTLSAEKRACYLDLERAYDPEWWTEVGVDISKLEVASPSSAEEAIDMVVALVEDEVELIVVDSLAAMVPADEGEAEADQGFVGLQARLNGRFYRVVTSKNNLLLGRQTHILVINQIRESIGVVYGNPQIVPGGKAKNFFSSTMIQCKRDGWIEEDKLRKGWYLKYEVLKQRGRANPGDSVTIPVLFSGHIDTVRQAIEMGLAWGTIKQDKAHYTIVGEGGEVVAKFYGKPKLTEALMEDEELLQRLLTLLP